MTSWEDFLSASKKIRVARRKSYHLNGEKIQRIRNSRGSRRVCYPEMQSAFDYVHEIYPYASIRQATVYSVSQPLLKEVGYRGVGGFYDTLARIVCITDCMDGNELSGMDIQAEYTLDEVLCHELIHYGANYRNALSNRSVEEEIAYGKSINYLRANGRTDDFIIRKNMMPYLVSVVNRKEIYYRVLLGKYDANMLSKASAKTLQLLIEQENDAVVRETISDGYKIGLRMISLYGDKSNPCEIVKNRFRKLDLDDDL